MKFNVPSKNLQTQLQAVSKVINTKNAMSILDNFLFEVTDSRLVITGSDQENVMTASLEVYESDSDGRIALNAKRLLDMLKEVPNQGLTFDIDTDTMAVDIRFQGGHFNFMGTDPAEYPQTDLTSNESTPLTLPVDVVLHGIDSTLFAVSTDTLRPMMMGIYWDIHENDITFVSSDTHKLVRYINTEVQPGMERAFIMPAKPATILKGIITKEDTELTISIGEKNATFTLGSYTLTCRFINGNYPNYNRVIPQDTPYTLTIDRQSLLTAVRRVSLFASMASGLIRLHISSDNMHLSAQDIDYSVSAEEDLSCSYDGTEMTIGFKAPFMIEVLGNLKSDTVVILLADPSRPGIFLPETQGENEDILMLLMPMQTYDY